MSSKSSIQVAYGQEYLDYQTNRNWFRKLVRKLYLNKQKSYLVGTVLDFGCGSGELLKKIEHDCVGLEVNKNAVKYCKKNGLNVHLYDPISDDYSFSQFTKFDSLVMSHVLEHLAQPEIVLTKILKSCFRLGVKRILLIVPGKKGFLSDKTHKKFIDINFIMNNYLNDNYGYELREVTYFPLNNKIFGDLFTHNESLFIYEKK